MPGRVGRSAGSAAPAAHDLVGVVADLAGENASPARKSRNTSAATAHHADSLRSLWQLCKLGNARAGFAIDARRTGDCCGWSQCVVVRHAQTTNANALSLLLRRDTRTIVNDADYSQCHRVGQALRHIDQPNNLWCCRRNGLWQGSCPAGILPPSPFVAVEPFAATTYPLSRG